MAKIKGKWVFSGDLINTTEVNQLVNFTAPDYTTGNNTFIGLNSYYTYSDGWTTTYVWTTLSAITVGDYGAIGYSFRLIDFGETEQTVSDTFLAWMQANATPEADPTPTDAVTIEYNGAVIASLKAGQSATLHCMGDNVKMLTDIDVNVPAGMSGVELISFNIGDGSVVSVAKNVAIDGMTWEQWCNSPCNNLDYKIVGEEIKNSTGDFSVGYVISGMGQPVTVNDKIIENVTYSLSGGGGGSNR